MNVLGSRGIRAEMGAIVDKKINGPCTHVFALGVSRYRHLEDGDDPTDEGKESQLAQLTSAARSASEFAAWALNEYNNPDAPLASLYVCAAPTDGELLHPDIKAGLGAELSATRSAVMNDWLAFRKRCRENREAVAIVYAAGHGVQLTGEGAIMLLEDYAGPDQESALWAAFDMKGLHESMNGADVAARQFWFIDSCRERPEIAARFESLRGAFAGDVPTGHCESSPIFLAAGPRARAWARIDGVSLFNEALLACLRRNAATPPPQQNDGWRVTTGSLAAVLKPHVLKASGSAQQVVELTGHLGTTTETLHVFKQPPTAKVTVQLTPEQAQDSSTASLYLAGKPVIEDADQWPIERELKSGIYTIQVSAEAPYANTLDSVPVKPPSTSYKVTVPDG